jgi:DNA-binding transcriptional ArsR family regulator
MVRDVVVVSDPKILKVGIEETRLKILALLKFNDLAVSQIAQVLGKDESTIYRHIEKLRLAGYIQVAGERTVHHIPERIYRRTAQVFILSPDELPDEEGRDILKERRRNQLHAALGVIEKMGHKMKDKGSTEDLLLKIFTDAEAKAARDFKGVNDAALADMHVFWRTRILLLLISMRDDPEMAKRVEEALKGIGR